MGVIVQLVGRNSWRRPRFLNDWWSETSFVKYFPVRPRHPYDSWQVILRVHILCLSVGSQYIVKIVLFERRVASRSYVLSARESRRYSWSFVPVFSLASSSLAVVRLRSVVFSRGLWLAVH